MTKDVIEWAIAITLVVFFKIARTIVYLKNL